MMLVALGYGIIAVTDSYVLVLAGAAVSGFGVGAIFPNTGLWVTGLAPPRLRGRLLGMMTAAMYLGQFSSPILVQPSVAAFGLSDTFGLFAAIAAAVAAALFLLRGRLEPKGLRRA
jgi:MFS family permease